jgi:hypothetical protein
MPVVLDHLFILTDAGAPAAERLIEFGLAEGTRNRHPGQGTENRRFFFQNSMLELLWVCDAAEAASELVRPTGLWERWSRRETGICPFGLILRPEAPGSGDVPFEAREYRPPYLPHPLVFQVAANTPLSEPLLTYMDFARTAPMERHDHPAGLKEVTGVRLTSPVEQPSAALAALLKAGVFSLRHGLEHHLEIGFDGERQQREADFRPHLPLSFRW